MGRKVEVQETVNKIFIFCQAIFALPQSCAYGTCHASHTLDTLFTAKFFRFNIKF